jgi:hypothetical protein
MLGGMQLHLYLDGFMLNIFGGKTKVTYQGNQIPRMFIDLHQIDFSLVIHNNESNECMQNTVDFNIKMIKILDNYIPERIYDDN